ADGAAVTREGVLLGRAADAAAMAHLLGAARRQPVVLRLPAGTALWRRISLPLAAEANPRQVVGFDIDRLTPWPAEAVAFDCRLGRRDAAAKRIEVEVLAAPAAAVAAALEHAARLGIDPVAVDADSPSAHRFDLTPPRRRRRWSRRPRVVVAVLVPVALAVVFAIALAQRTDTARRLEAEVAAAGGHAEAAGRLRDRLEQVRQQAAFLHQRKTARPPMVVALDRLSQVLGDETWLTQVEIAGGELQLWGYSPNAAAVARALEEAEDFTRAEFRAPLTQDPQNGLERFHLAAGFRR
ncbi:MAG: PilN domain-containing protein, partial [Magnetospirillum sp.]|nr:PilN domain-containing protein [Magnetospirillum sp.]